MAKRLKKKKLENMKTEMNAAVVKSTFIYRKHFMHEATQLYTNQKNEKNISSTLIKVQAHKMNINKQYTCKIYCAKMCN